MAVFETVCPRARWMRPQEHRASTKGKRVMPYGERKFLVPDLSLLTYFHGPTAAGSDLYNVMHPYVLPFLPGILAAPLDSALLGELSLIWIAQVSMDRMLGYGLK